MAAIHSQPRDERIKDLNSNQRITKLVTINGILKISVGRLDRRDKDIAYFYPSRLPGETADGVNDVHYHPVQSDRKMGPHGAPKLSIESM